MTKNDLLSTLRGLDACDRALDWIEASKYKTPKALWNHCPDGHWLDRLCLLVIRHEYGAVLDAVWNEYEQVRDAALAKFERISEPAMAAARKANYTPQADKAWAKYQRVRDSAWEEYRKVRGPALADAIRSRVDYKLLDKALAARKVA